MEVSPETKLNKQLAFSYQSFSSNQVEDGSSSIDLNRKHDPIPLKQLVSGSPNPSDQHLSNIKETDDLSSGDTPVPVYVVSIIIAAGVTFALILQIYLGGGLVCHTIAFASQTTCITALFILNTAAPQASINGALVSDHERCTALGQRVLQDGGSSVDAAVAGVLCLGVVHPHVSGVGGGGVMLVHDIHKNETRVINFQGTAPKTFRKEMLHNVSGLKRRESFPVFSALVKHVISQIHCSLSWEDVVSRAADVAREGFTVTDSLADAISKVESEQLSQRFRDIFIPEGRALRAGSFVRIPGLSGVLEAGLLNFYYGNLSQEIEDEVRANGGVLSREDISNYSVEVEQPLEVQYSDYIIQVPPPPSAGAALISALNILSENNITENQTHPWIDETELLLQRMNDSHTPPSDSTAQSLHAVLLAGQVIVMGPDNLVVSVASSLNRPFGSRIITQSGIILNSLLLDCIWSNKTQGQLQTQQVQHYYESY
ncbi:glutathione hydrolase 7-like [Acanthochromis polyacanthus]|uniref:glutathione hydrolase 7-like n=1 Tax=Acanthochromis polyacanthus TaxID=80966 RepID=UPI0022346D82|nr:glutathione hydrolase 7-like [Acanthochromis polyacanthus]